MVQRINQKSRKSSKKAVNYGINKLTPFIQDSVGSALDQLSTKVRLNKKYKTDRKGLDGRGIDIHNAILKVVPKKVLFYQVIILLDQAIFLRKQLKYNPETEEILEIYQQPTGRTDAVSMQHDVDYSVCGNKPKSEQVKCKNEAERKMVISLDAIPCKERQWGPAMAITLINTKQKLGTGLKSKNVKRR